MPENASVSPKQSRLLTLLLQGSSIVDAAKTCKINECTAHRWLKQPAVQQERERRQAALREAEQQAIERILMSGYALMHERVKALNELAELLHGEVFDEEKRWLPDVKSVGTGPTAERVDLIRFNSDLISEYRATFTDLAAELGHRIKKQSLEHTGKDGKPIQTQQVEIYKVRLPDNGRDSTEG